MSERITFTIPFEGFYQTDLDEELDNHILRLNGMTWDDPWAAELLMKVNYEATHAQIAKQYAIEWLKVRELPSGKFEKYTAVTLFNQPREQLLVSVDSEELLARFTKLQEDSEQEVRPTVENGWRTAFHYWSEAWEMAEDEIPSEEIVSHEIRETLMSNGHMDPIFKE